MRVTSTSKPPARLEGGGFTIRDILSDVAAKRADPFLIWHELPRSFHRPGDFPGAPRHPHRGFMECPYMKEITAETGSATTTNTVWAAGEQRTLEAVPGHFELGKVGVGMEHEMVTDRRWSGYLHGFQLWVNLPGARKFDAPHFQNAAPSALPVADLGSGATARIMHGKLGESQSPTECDVVQWQYLDFELAPSGAVSHDPPPSMSTRFAYVYIGDGSFSGTRVDAGTLAVLEGTGALRVEAGREGCGFLFIAGAPINEPIVQHGPFVMNTREQIQDCFRDFQKGSLCPEKITQVSYT